MNDPDKIFDVTTPRPSSTSRPIIVGHMPTTADPMVASVSSALPQSPPAPMSIQTHQAKVIPVSNDMRDELAKPPTPMPESNPTPAPNAVVAPTQPIVQNSFQPAAVLQTVPLQAAPVTAPAQPTAPVPAEPPQTIAPQQAFTGSFQPQVPPPPTPASAPIPAMPTRLEVHSLPVAHEPVSGAHRLRALLVWLVVIIILAGVGGFLALDAGIIHSSLKLPFHIFGPAN
jgi:hypothetical protein